MVQPMTQTVGAPRRYCDSCARHWRFARQQPATLLCQRCGAPFTVLGLMRKYCGPACAHAGTLAAKGVSSLKQETRACQQCSGSFTPRYAGQRHCGDACAQRTAAARLRIWHQAQPRKEHVCEGCGVRFGQRKRSSGTKKDGRNRNAFRFCSRACAYQHADLWSHTLRRFGRGRRKAISRTLWPWILRACRQCDGPVSRRSNAQFCSQACRREWSRADAMQRYIQQRNETPRVYRCRRCAQLTIAPLHTKFRVFCTVACAKAFSQARRRTYSGLEQEFREMGQPEWADATRMLRVMFRMLTRPHRALVAAVEQAGIVPAEGGSTLQVRG